MTDARDKVVEAARALGAFLNTPDKALFDAIVRVQDAAKALPVPGEGEARTFPIQSELGAAAHPTRIPWWLADRAYSVYRARHGSEQSLERLAQRGGFGPSEMDEFVPGWREKCAPALRAEEAERVAREAVRLAEACWGHVDPLPADEIVARAVKAAGEQAS